MAKFVTLLGTGIFLGIDISSVAIERNRNDYPFENLTFEVYDCTELTNMESESFDFVLDKCFIDSVT